MEVRYRRKCNSFFLRLLFIWVTVSLYSLINSKWFKTEEYLAFSHALFMKLSRVKRRGNNKRLILCRRYSVLDFLNFWKVGNRF